MKLFKLLIAVIILYVVYLLFDKKNEPLGHSKTINLHQLNPNTTIMEYYKGKEIYDNVSKKKYSPMFLNPLNAKKLSKTNSVHVVIPGILPASNRTWKNYSNNQAFYMPNDLKPHFHGDAEHHQAGKGFDIDEVFLVSSEDFVEVENKQLAEYRAKIEDFNYGLPNTPVETWIHWKIPYNQKPYPKLIVKKDSIIWWDFNDHHNLNLVSKYGYDNNKAGYDSVLLAQAHSHHNGSKHNLKVIVTIMDKPGTYYFLCSVPGHGQLGHKIIIEVTD